MNPQITSVQNSESNAVTMDVVESGEELSALETLKTTLMALPEHEVRKVTVLAPHAVSVGRHYARRYAEDRSVFAQGLAPSVWIPEDYDNMELRAKALWEADLALDTAIREDRTVAFVVTAAREVKGKLFRTGMYLWGDDTKKTDELAKIKSGGSHLDLADDIFTLYHLFTNNLEDAKVRSDVNEESLKSAMELGEKLLDVIGPARDERIREARDLRNRAAEFLFRGIDDIRAAAYFLFRKDQKALDRYPSLYIGRNRRRSSDNDNMETTGEESPQTLVSSDSDSEVADEMVG